MSASAPGEAGWHAQRSPAAAGPRARAAAARGDRPEPPHRARMPRQRIEESRRRSGCTAGVRDEVPIMHVTALRPHVLVSMVAAIVFAAGLGVLSVAEAGARRDAPLVAAVKAADVDAVRTLIGEQGVDVNQAEPDGATALHWAVHRNDAELVDLLIAAGADVAAANRYGVQPISLAAENGNAAILDALLDAGADPNAVLPEGETVLMTAARTGDAASIRALLVRGADPNARDSFRGQTALMWAASRNNADSGPRARRAGCRHVHARTESAARGPNGNRLFYAPPPTGFTALTVRGPRRAHRRDARPPRGRRRHRRHAVRRAERARGRGGQRQLGVGRLHARPGGRSEPGRRRLERVAPVAAHAPHEHRLRVSGADPERQRRQHRRPAEDDRARRGRRRADDDQRDEGRAAQPPEPARRHAVLPGRQGDRHRGDARAGRGGRRHRHAERRRHDAA